MAVINARASYQPNKEDSRRKNMSLYSMAAVSVVACLTLSIAIGWLLRKDKLPEHKSHVLGMSLKAHDDAKNKIEKMQSMVSPDQQIFLSSLSTGSEVTVAEGILKEEYLDYIEETFKSGDWPEQDRAKMRKLKYATSVEKKNSLNCDLEKGQKCMLSKLQVLVRHFKDVDKVEKMNLYYSYSKVNFSLQQLQSVEEAGNNGWFWNVGFFSKPKPEQKISLEALGHFFIQYTSQEQDREFYRQVVNMIDLERDLDAPKRFGQNNLKPENSGENNSEEK